jgi:hypothetical protein
MDVYCLRGYTYDTSPIHYVHVRFSLYDTIPYGTSNFFMPLYVSSLKEPGCSKCPFPGHYVPYISSLMEKGAFSNLCSLIFFFFFWGGVIQKHLVKLKEM